MLQLLRQGFQALTQQQEPEGPLQSPRLQRYLTTEIKHGPAHSEICYFVGTKNSDGSGWLLEKFTENAQFDATFGGEDEIEVRQLVGRREIANCNSYAALSKKFHQEVHALKQQGFEPERQHQLDVVVLPPHNATVTPIMVTEPTPARTPEISELTGTNIVAFTGLQKRGL